MAGEGGWDEAGAAGFGEKKLKNTLPLYANKDSMNMNSMILTNILGSPYFKEELINFKTFHEVVDEIYYKVRNGGYYMGWSLNKLLAGLLDVSLM